MQVGFSLKLVITVESTRVPEMLWDQQTFTHFPLSDQIFIKFLPFGVLFGLPIIKSIKAWPVCLMKH